MKKYSIEVNESQAQLLVRALDLYSRIGIGQFEEVSYVYNHRLPVDQKAAIRAGLNQAKVAAGHPVNGSYGIHSPEVRDEFRSAVDMQQVIRHRLAWDHNPEGGIQVNFDEPHQIGAQPLPKITITEMKNE